MNYNFKNEIHCSGNNDYNVITALSANTTASMALGPFG